MAKLIFTSRYIRDAPPEHLQNYVRYISTREESPGDICTEKSDPTAPERHAGVQRHAGV